METLLSYSQYDSLVVFDVDNDDGISVWESSNKANSLSYSKKIKPEEIVDEDLGLSAKDIFLMYFQLQSRDKEQLSALEASTLQSILNYFRNIKAHLTTRKGLSIKTSQIIVAPPSFAEWDEGMLRDLFLEAEWITTEDDDTKLILVPYIEAYANAFQMSNTQEGYLEREGKYMMLYMQPSEEHRKIIYTAVCFQMQCAKELIAVSKRLASSDFLLVPSILSSRTTSLPSLDDALLTAVKEAISRFRNNHKVRHGVKGKLAGLFKHGRTLFSAFNDAAANVKDQFKMQFGVESRDSELATELKNELLWMGQDKYNSRVSDLLSLKTLANFNLEELAEESLDKFCMDISQDTNVKQHTDVVCNFLQESLNQHSVLNNAPDGIHSIILVREGVLSYLHCFCLETAVDQAKLRQYEGGAFTHWVSSARAKAAIQRSLKIIRIANAFLPPLIHSDDEGFAETAQTDSKCEKDSALLPLNSFYLQANIGERQIEFILNKVVKAPSFTTSVGLFTAQENTIEMEDIQTTTSANMWNYYQRLELEGHLDALTSCCPEHQNIALSFGHYRCFVANMADLIDNWFQSEQTLSNDELDTYHRVSINKDCACALKISQRMLLEAGLRPAIASIAEIIVGFTLSVDYFGLYQLLALFVKEDMNAIANEYYSHSLTYHIQERVKRLLQSHHRKITTILVNKKTENAMRQYLARGTYSQMASSTYTMVLETFTTKDDFVCGFLDDRLNAYIKCPNLYFDIRNNAGGNFQAREVILKKGEDIPATGFERTFLTVVDNVASIDCNVSSSFRVKTKPIPVTLLHGPKYGHYYKCFTIYVLPVHYSTALRVSVSYIKRLSNGAASHHFASVDIQERLSLKRTTCSM